MSWEFLNIPSTPIRLGRDANEIRYTYSDNTISGPFHLIDPPPRIDEPKGTGMTKWISLREVDAESGKDIELVYPLIPLSDRLKLFK